MFFGINISFNLPAKICIASTDKNTIKSPNNPEHRIERAQKIYVPIQYFVLSFFSVENIVKYEKSIDIIVVITKIISFVASLEKTTVPRQVAIISEIIKE